MCSRFLKAFAVAVLAASVARSEDMPVLRVAADPNNLPFSNERLEGYENKLAALVANDLGMELRWVWHAQRRGFFRETLKQGDADLVMSVPAGFDMALTTKPYYRSSYMFVYPKSRAGVLSSFDDPYLRTARIGIQLVGNDGMDTPPAHAFAKRGMITNVVGFTLYGNYREENPPARIMDALEAREIDCAVVWGPLAGYFAKRIAVPLTLVAVSPASEPPLRYTFNIAMGVRRKNAELQGKLNEWIVSRRQDIRTILEEYGIPQLPIEVRSTERKVD
jgi:mxaJ protein